MKAIAISFTEGRVIRDFFENGLVEMLQGAGVKVIFFTPAERVPYFKSEWEQKGVNVYPLKPYTQSTGETRAENIRKRIKNRSTLLHHKFLEHYHRFFRSDSELEDILKKENCSLVLITNPMFRYETALWATAKRIGIKTLGAIRSWDNLHQGLKIFPDNLAVWNKINKTEAVKLMGMPAEKIHITGACQFDQYFNANLASSRETFCKELNLDPERPIITLATIGNLWYGYDENYIVDEIVSYIVDRKIPGMPQLVLRLHPVTRYETMIKYESYDFVRISNIKEHIPTLGWTMRKQDVGFVGNLLKHSDIVISPGSTITIETAIFDTQTIFPTFHNYQPEFGKQCYDIVMALHHKRLKELKLVNLVEKKEDFLGVINRALSDSSWFKKERHQLFDDYITFSDGKSTERLFQLILKESSTHEK